KSPGLRTGRGRAYLFSDSRLFTTDPASPRCGPAGAVDERAREADEFALGCPGLGVDDDRGRPAARGRVVMVRRADGGIGTRHAAVDDLVIADEASFLADLEGPHPVMPRRDRASVRHL